MHVAEAALFLVGILASSAWVEGQQVKPSGAGSAAQAALNRAADAILALKSARFTLQREGTPAFLDEKNGITFTAADCTYAAPDRVSCNVKVGLKNGTILQLTRVWVPEGTFQSNPLTRQFGRLPADASFNGVVLFARTGIPDILRASVQKAEIVGKEQVQGRDTVRLKGQVSGEKLNPLMGATLKSDAIYPVDMWLDERSSHPVKFHITESGNDGWLIELAGVDEPVTIPTPQLPPPPTSTPQA